MANQKISGLLKINPNAMKNPNAPGLKGFLFVDGIKYHITANSNPQGELELKGMRYLTPQELTSQKCKEIFNKDKYEQQ